MLKNLCIICCVKYVKIFITFNINNDGLESKGDMHENKQNMYKSEGDNNRGKQKENNVKRRLED